MWRLNKVRPSNLVATPVQSPTSYDHVTIQGGIDMGNPVIWFEIHGQDSTKLHDFYRAVFGWTIDADNPMSYGFVKTGSEEGIQGAIATGQGTRGVTLFL